MSDVTLTQLYQDYELFKTVKDCTKAKARAAFTHLVTFAGDVPAAQLGPGKINKWATWLGARAINPRTKKPGLIPAEIDRRNEQADLVVGRNVLGIARQRHRRRHT